MVSNPWLRFGLPLGSAMILVIFLETAFLSASWLYVVEYTLFHGSHSGVEIETQVAVMSLLVAIWVSLTLSILCNGTVKARWMVLICWITATTLDTFLTFSSQLVQTSNNGNWMDFFVEGSYSWIAHTCFSVYKIGVVIQCTQTIILRSPLEPIGQGVRRIMRFYAEQENNALGIRIVLTGELVLLAQNALAKNVIAFVRTPDLSDAESEGFGAIVAEEFVIRGLRCIVTSVGIYIMVKASSGKSHHLKYWSFVYFGLFVASLCNAAYLVFIWNDKHEFLNLSYYMILVASLIYRAWTLYICLPIVAPYILASIPYALQSTSSESRGIQPQPRVCSAAFHDVSVVVPTPTSV